MIRAYNNRFVKINKLLGTLFVSHFQVRSRSLNEEFEIVLYSGFRVSIYFYFERLHNRKDQTVNVFDRHGEKKIEISLPGEVVHMAWDLEGDNLAIIDDKTSLVTLWDSLSFKLGQINTGLKKVSLLGKHLRRISCAAWNKNNLLALASEDMVISVNSPEGDLLRQNGVRDIPSDLQFAEVRRPESFTGSENSISCVLGSKNLFILSLDESESPIELAFQTRYGDIVSYHWFGDGYIMIGFTLGYFIVISTQKSEIGKEIYQVCDHKDGLWDIAVSPVLNRCATAGDHCVKIHDLLNVRELLAIIEIEEDRRPGRETQTTFRNNRGAFQLQWSDDGQLMAVSTQRQLLHVFLSQLPMLASVVSSGTANLTARLTSLLEVTVEQLPFSKVSFVEKLKNVLRDICFGFEVVSDYDYLDVVTNVSVNDTYAAACGPSGKLTLHWIDPKTFPTKDGLRNEIMRASPAAAVRNNLFPMTTREQRMFPDCSKNGSRQANMKITGFRLTADFLIYATDVSSSKPWVLISSYNLVEYTHIFRSFQTGQLTHFLLEDWANLHEYQHKTGIRSIHPNSKGTRVALIDDQAGAFVYNPVLFL
ncbi:WD repeat-containing protein 19 [Paragonimus westermani]|uniref:WD repeat-containing protein 19 n=1 Tax=Paragonimus westermani TaxID=34504 RepID=A0A5J4NL87_9TREM|nr:WD repeat-containing protein 19 [Paragonimus westermani]